MSMTKNKNVVTTAQIRHIANLANIPITSKEEESLRDAFEETLDVISDLQSVDIKNVDPTHQVTGFENVLREDVINGDNMFSQDDALKNAKKTHDGYFVVPRLIDKDN